MRGTFSTQQQAIQFVPYTMHEDGSVTFMNKLLLILVFISLYSFSYAQSAFKLVKILSKSKSHKIVSVCRTTRVPIQHEALARNVVNLANPYLMRVSKVKGYYDVKCLPVLHIVTEFSAPILKNPETIYGGYNYLRILATASKERGVVSKGFVPIWKSINKTQGYNGVHHIVNKSTIKAIHSVMKREYRASGKNFTIRLDEMQNTAPAVFHVFHGNPRYTNVFHNSTQQIIAYKTGGVRKIILDYFNTINEINISNGMKPIHQSVVEGTLKEAELWAKTFKLRWR